MTNLDLKIIGGQLFDGTGGEPVFSDVGIVGDCIEVIGDLTHVPAKETIDASGCIVTPGFIDSHSHSDTYLLLEPSAASKVYQGITTEICGNCGASAAPLNGSYKMPSDWLDKEYPRPWKSVSDYRTCFEEASPAINMALLIGHNTLHAGVCGYEPRGATPDEMKVMQVELSKALDEGVIGISSGLAYPPGSAVPRSELIELTQTVAKRGGIYTTHMRSESDQLLESIDEAIEITDRAGAKLQVSHLKASGETNWDKLDQALERVRVAGAGADRYPYTAGCTDLDIVLPQWASYGGRDAILGRIRDEVTCEKIRTELLDKPADHWDNVMIGSTQFEEYKGKYLPEVAEVLKMKPVDAMLYLIDKDDLKTGGIFFSMSEKNMWKVLAEPYVSLGSDGSLRAPCGVLSKDHPHPRAYGSHTKFLRASLDGYTVGFSEAIRKMTSLPAAQFNLKKRGVLKQGYFADILVFDSSELLVNTTYAKPHQLSAGMRHVIVNGRWTLKDGKQTPDYGGRFLER